MGKNKIKIVTVIIFVFLFVIARAEETDALKQDPWWFGGMNRLAAMGGLSFSLFDISVKNDAYDYDYISAMVFRDKKNIVSISPSINIGRNKLDYSVNVFRNNQYMTGLWLTNDDCLILKPVYLKTNFIDGDYNTSKYLFSFDLQYARRLSEKTAAGARLRYLSSEDSSNMPFYASTDMRYRIDWSVDYSWTGNAEEYGKLFGPDAKIAYSVAIGNRRSNVYDFSGVESYPHTGTIEGCNREFNFKSGTYFLKRNSSNFCLDLSFANTITTDKDGSGLLLNLAVLSNLLGNSLEERGNNDIVESRTKTGYFGIGVDGEVAFKWVIYKNWILSGKKILTAYFEKNSNMQLDISQNLGLGILWKNDCLLTAFEYVEGYGLRFGAEGNINKTVYLRSGYNINTYTSEEKASAGIGFDLKDFIVNASVLKGIKNSDYSTYLMADVKLIF